MRLCRSATAFAFALLAACTPRPGVVETPAPVPPPAPAPMAAAERAASAAELFDEGIALGREGRWALAAERYRAAAQLQPWSPAYHMALANALLHQGREWDGADALLAGIRAEEALPAPNHRVLAVDYDRLIQLLDRLGRADEAREARVRQEHHRRQRDAMAPE